VGYFVDLKKNPNPRNQKISLFLKLNSSEKIKPWELKKKAERIKRTPGSRCNCVDLIPLKQSYQGEDELWELMGARLECGTGRDLRSGHQAFVIEAFVSV